MRTSLGLLCVALAAAGFGKFAYAALAAAHPTDGPAIEHVCAVAPDILSITLQAGTYVANRLTPYDRQPGDEIVDENPKETHYTVKNGAVIEDHDKALYRTLNGARTRIAALSPDGAHLFYEGKMAGKILDETNVDAPAAYSIQSAGDPAYAQPLAPTAVFRKGKPDGHNSNPAPFVYTISLKLPSPLKEGAAYTLRFAGVNTSKESVTYVHNPRRTGSDAVHAIQTGYRPDDPFKRAYLSVWLGVSAEAGKSGGVTHHLDSFELIDAATGKTVFTGKPELTKAQDAREWLCVHEEKDYTQTSVQRLDFSAFNTPGEYQVYVPGIGVSETFRIARDVWEKPFKTALLGILTQRQGIELGPPLCDFKRARAFHPDDGVEFYQLTMTVHEGQEGERGANMLELAKAGKLERVNGVWGGYQDAGDWDTLGHHLSITYLLLELYELAPEYFAAVKLSLPRDEQTNALPDLLDEAMWQMPCFRRLQLPDGAVRGGYGEGWGCRRAQTSPMVKAAGVYAPDQVTSYDYAACAAKASRILAAFDKKQAGEYLESGVRAWEWAEGHSNDTDPVYRRLTAQKDRWPAYPEAIKNARVRAAVELFAATHKPVYHDAFKQLTELSKPAAPRPVYLDQSDADFAYARLPDDLADAALKKRAVETFAAYADYAIDFSHKNAFEIINGSRTDLPVIGPCTYFSAPGVRGYNLIRANVLTKKNAYLAAAVQACNYSLGANPGNLSYCPGIGRNCVRFPFKVDAAVSGQYPGQPVGYIPFGQGDEGGKMSKSGSAWVEQWFLNFQPPKMIPDFYTWPANEVYIDFGIYPMMNENCVDTSTLAAVYFWGYLAARP